MPTQAPSTPQVPPPRDFDKDPHPPAPTIVTSIIDLTAEEIAALSK